MQLGSSSLSQVSKRMKTFCATPSHHLVAEKIQQNLKKHFQYKREKYSGTNDKNLNKYISTIQGGNASITVKNLMQEILFAPHLTAHPTNPRSVEIEPLIKDLYSLGSIKNKLALLKSRKDISGEQKNKKLRNFAQKLETISHRYSLDDASLQLNGNIENDVHTLMEMATRCSKAVSKKFYKSPVRPDKPLTVKQEIQRNLDTVTTVFNKIPSVIKTIVAELQNNNTRFSKDELTHELLNDNSQFIRVHSWAGADADGNKNVTPDTMRSALIMHQRHMLKIIGNAVDDIIAKEEKNNPHNIHIINSIKDIKLVIEDFADKYANNTLPPLSDRNNYRSNIMNKIDNIILNNDNTENIQMLKKQIQQIGFTDPKLDVRQSSDAHIAFLSDAYSIMNKNSSRTFEDLNQGEKSSFIDSLYKNEESLKKLVDKYDNGNGERFSNDAKLEIDRMIVTQEFPDTFSEYRISDARSADNVKTLRVLEKMAQIKAGLDKEEQVPKIDVIVLAETEKDIKNLPHIIKSMLEENLYANNTIKLFPGYSDAQKRMGITGLHTINEAMKDTIDVIQEFNAEQNHKNAAEVKIDICHGGGEDRMRLSDGKKREDTRQGNAGQILTNEPIFKDEIYTSATLVETSHTRAVELKKLQKSPELVKLLNNIIDNGRFNYRNLVSHDPNETYQFSDNTSKNIHANGDKTAELLTQIAPNEIVTATNVSSRAGSKPTNLKRDLDKERAIGLAAAFHFSGTAAQLLTGLPTSNQLKDSSSETKQHLFESYGTIRNIALRTLYTAATTDFDRAWNNLSESEKPQSSSEMLNKAKKFNDNSENLKKEDVLSYLQVNAYDVVKAQLELLPLTPEDTEKYTKQIDTAKSNLNDPKNALREILPNMLAEIGEKYKDDTTLSLFKDISVEAKEMQNGIQNNINMYLDKYKKDTSNKDVKDALIVALKYEQEVPAVIVNYH